MLQQRISAAELDNSNLQLELTSLKEELARAQQDIKRYSEDATQTQELYQRELMQHSKSVQSLVEIKEKVRITIFLSLVHSYMLIHVQASTTNLKPRGTISVPHIQIYEAYQVTPPSPKEKKRSCLSLL